MKRETKKKKLSLSVDKIRELKSTDQLQQVAGGAKQLAVTMPCGISYNK